MSKTLKNNFLNDLTWDDVEWHKSYNKVRSIQKRIFKASKRDDKKRVWFLQKLLLRNPHAKLVSVHQVTTLNKGKSTPGIDGYVAVSKEMKLKLTKNLCINGKATKIRRVWIPKPGKTEKRPLGIPTIQDRAKQALCKLALEPEWEAKYEANSYGFRPGRSSHDAIEAIFSHLHHNVDKYVFDADIKKCFDKISHEALLRKLETFPLFERQIKAWLKSGVFGEYVHADKASIPSEMGTPQGGIISPLLANIALHGLEKHLKDFVSTRTFPKPHPSASRGSRAKRSALGIVRYADDFVIIHRNKEIITIVIDETRRWLSNVGLEISDEKSALRLASQGFNFLDFRVIYVKRNEKFRVKITPAKENVKRLSEKVKNIIHRNKSASAYKLIIKLRPVILGWGNYFQFCECAQTFSKVDNTIFQQLRAWVFRRAVRQGRIKVKLKYFPEGRTYKFQEREYKANWILNGVEKKAEKPRSTFLPKLSWMKSRKYIKVSGTRSVFDNDEIYWSQRTTKYSSLSTRVNNLLRRQNGCCNLCNNQFVMGDHMEVDHIIPTSLGGEDAYKNLQLLHRSCHVLKTKTDLLSQTCG